MPMHAWEMVPAGLYHHFHQVWTPAICRVLNNGILPDGFDALVEQRKGPKEADKGGTKTMERPHTRLIRESESDYYTRKSNLIVIRHRLGRIVAMIEVVSPGNKNRKAALRKFLAKMVQAVDQGIQLMMLDPLPPGRHDPQGMHKLLWERIGEDVGFEFPAGEDRVLASYEIDDLKTAFVETAGVGQPLPDMPLFLLPGHHVMVPLEAAYDAAWADTPKSIKRLLV